MWPFCQVGWVGRYPGLLQRQGKQNLQVFMSSCSLWGRQGENLEHVGGSYLWISMAAIHSSEGNIA